MQISVIFKYVWLISKPIKKYSNELQSIISCIGRKNSATELLKCAF